MSNEPYTVILGDGLNEEVLSPQIRHLAMRTNIGEREIERLFGRGRSFGHGPLPRFLDLALEEHDRGGRVSLILLAESSASMDGSEGFAITHFAPPLDRIAEQSHVVACQPGRIPWDELRRVILEQTGIDPTIPVAGGSGLRFLVVGCHTEERILALSVFLRRVFACDEVAVSSHLVASATQEAHMAVLRHTLPGLGVKVLLDLSEAALFVGIDPAALSEFAATPCALEPKEVSEVLSDDQRRIIELLCLHWTRATLRPLAGGFSGSLLYIAQGWKGDARTEPMVLKVDAFDQMRRELAGYYQVKDFLGMHVPAFGYPVIVGEYLGVGMDLAAMEGSPQTLQETFELAEDETSMRVFLRRLDKALDLLVDRLYRNTCESSWIVPYRDFGLHAEMQQIWLRENAEIILGYLGEVGAREAGISLDQLIGIFRLITASEAGIDGKICLAHGDLNFANVICDEGDNVWLIDWTHCGRTPLELDFAKLENDVKFVMMKSCEREDLPRLRKFEEYLVDQRIPALGEDLPDHLSFAKWDLRFRKLLDTVRRIRTACFSLLDGEDWVVYRIALLRYATHTLSFDEARGRGECNVTQLAHALHSVDYLAFNLVSDLFHLRIRTEVAEGYPERQVITIDEAPWMLDCEEYAPPYYVAQTVLDNGGAEGWADPENYSSMGEELAARPARRRDEEGRPLNPTGRTGIAGRGLLGFWGGNLAVAGLFVRPSEEEGELEVALGQELDQARLELPKGFILPREETTDGIGRVLETETGCRPVGEAKLVFEGYTYDSRQTDHAWVETNMFLYYDSEGRLPALFAPSGHFEEMKWWPLDADTINRVSAGQAVFLRAAVQGLSEASHLQSATAEALLASTG